jgi:hypothetical protein
MAFNGLLNFTAVFSGIGPNGTVLAKRVNKSSTKSLLFEMTLSASALCECKFLSLLLRELPNLTRRITKRVSMRRSLLAVVSLFVLSSPVLASTVAVPLDEVRIVTFKRPAYSVYMGNPMIAEVTSIDPRHAYVLGKNFGTTNLIALDANGKPIASEQVTVFSQRMGNVTLQRGGAQYNYTCTAAHCEAYPVTGDEHTYFQNTHGDTEKHEDLGVKAAAASAPAR